MAKKYKILLICAGGFSTSMLVKKMLEVSEQEDEIWADGMANVEEEIEKADCVLLGPQIKFKLKEISALAEEKGIKADAIDMMAYGMMDAKKILKQAYDMIEGE